MTDTLRIEWTTIESMLQSMVDVGLQAGEIDDYFQEHVVNTRGLDYPTCALKPIGDLLPRLGSAFSQARSSYQKRWVEVIEAIAQTAAELDTTDNGIDIAFRRYVADLDSMPDATISVKIFEPKELTGLDAPDEGEPKLKHNETWETTSTGYDATRDGINGAIDFINELGVPGVSLPRLSEKSLEDYVVYPLAGNYRLLGANAEACSQIDGAFTVWAANFIRLSGQVYIAMDGQASRELATHLKLYALVMKAVGEAIEHGREVFDVIAAMSERIAVAVEHALVKMATKLTQLLAKLSSKLSPAGWAWFVAELLEKGFEAVTDIYDDLMECKAIIEACFDLVAEIEAWAHAMSDSLETLREIHDMVEQLPRVDAGGGLPHLPAIDFPDHETTLGEIAVRTTTDPRPEARTLDDRLDELEGDAEHEEKSEDDDGPMIMAPGPVEPVYKPESPSSLPQA